MIFWPTPYSNEFLWILTPLPWVSETFRQDIGKFLGWSPANWRIISSLISIFIMTNSTDLRKTVETGVDPRLLLQRHRISQGQFPTVDAACFDQTFCSWFCNTRSDKAVDISRFRLTNFIDCYRFLKWISDLTRRASCIFHTWIRVVPCREINLSSYPIYQQICLNRGLRSSSGR